MILCGFRGPVFDRTKSKMMWNFYGLIWISRSQVIPPTIYINHTQSAQAKSSPKIKFTIFFFHLLISMGPNNLKFEKYSIAIYDMTNNSNAQNVTDVVFVALLCHNMLRFSKFKRLLYAMLLFSVFKSHLKWFDRENEKPTHKEININIEIGFEIKRAYEIVINERLEINIEPKVAS